MDIQMGQGRRNNRRGIDRPAMLSLILVLIVGLVGPDLNPAVAAASKGPNSIVHWNTVALNTSITIGKQSIPQSQMYLARVQAAVYNAVVAIEGRYQPYKSSLAQRPEASVDVAVERRAEIALAHLAAVVIQDQRDMSILGRLHPKSPEQRDVLGCV